MIAGIETEPILPGASPLSTLFSPWDAFLDRTGDRPAEAGESAGASRIAENDGKREIMADQQKRKWDRACSDNSF
jgi:hypothetical protein